MSTGILGGSWAYRVAAAAVNFLTGAGSESLIGHFFAWLARGVVRWCSASTVFGLRSVETRPLSGEENSCLVSLLARLYLWLRRKLAPLGAAGRSGVAASGFAEGNWLTALGAGIVGLGVGCLVRTAWGLELVAGTAMGAAAGIPTAAATLAIQYVLSVLLLVAGALVAMSGPRLRPAFLASAGARAATRVGRVLMAEQPVPVGVPVGAPARSGGRRGAEGSTGWQVSRPVWIVAALAGVAGVLGGLAGSSGTTAVVAAGVVVVAGALILRRPEVMLLVVAAFPWVDWGARRLLGGLGGAWDDAFLVLSTLVLVWAILFLRRARLWTVPVLLPLLLALGAAFASVVVNGVPDEVGLFAMRVLFQPLLFYFVGFLFPKDQRWVQAVVALFILGSLGLALHGLYQYVTDAPMPISWVDAHEGDLTTRAYSIVGNPNGLGAFLLMGTLLSLSLALRRGLRSCYRWAMAVAFAVQAAGVAVTFSRGAWLGLAAGVLALFSVGYRRYLAPLVAAGVLGWLVLPAQFTERLAFAFSSTYIAKSLVAGRLFMWKAALLNALAHPLMGVGLGMFGGTTAVTFHYGRFWVDNFYLQLAAEGGLLLLALFLWLLLRAGKGLAKAYVANADPFLRALSAGVFGGFVAVAVANVTASVWETLIVGVAFWFLAGVATSTSLHGEAVSDKMERENAAEEG